MCDGRSTLVEVTHHRVAAPTREEFDDICVTSTYEQGHRTSSAETTGTDVRRRDARNVLEDTCVPAQGVGYLFWLDRYAHVVAIVVRRELDGAIKGSVSAAKLTAMEHELPDDGGDRATVGVTTPGVGYRLAFVAIFLCCEHKMHRGSGADLGVGREGIVQAPAAEEEDDIIQGKGFDWVLTSILARAEAVVEGHTQHIGDGLALRGRVLVVRVFQHLDDQGDRNGIDAFRGRVFLLVSTELGGETEVDVTDVIVTGVFGPHPRDLLADRTNRVRNRANCHGFATGREASITVADAKDLEEGDGVFNAVKAGIEGVRHTEIMPDAPMGVLASSVGCVNAKSHLFLQSAEIKFEFVDCRSWHKRHVVSWGKWELK